MPSEDPRKYPLYDTTFTLHRVSPLYTGNPLDNNSLQQHARSFRDRLVGDVLRGVRVGLATDNDSLAASGALQTVTWRLLPEENLWNTSDETELDATISSSIARGWLISVTYENAKYKAILLRGAQQEGQEAEGDDGFEHIPLLLMRMPGSLREAFIQFLTETFDTRVSVMRLQTPYLTSALEEYISSCSMRVLQNVISEVEIDLGFDNPTGNGMLYRIRIVTAREDLPRMVLSGKKIERTENREESPFITALRTHVDAHFALNMKHEMLKIMKIACAAFVLGEEGKAKITEPTVHDLDFNQSQATWRLIDSLVELAEGGELSKGIGD